MARSKYLLVKGAQGLGNRVFALLSAMVYARITGRKLVVDWSDGSYSPEGSNAIHHFFRSSLFSPADEIPDSDSVEPRIWRGRLRESAMAMAEGCAPRLRGDPFLWKRFSIDLSRLDYQEDVLVMWAFFPLVDLMRGHFRGEFSRLRRLDTDSILRETMHQYLELQPAVRERVDSMRRDWPRHPTLGVHVRHTDKKTDVRGIQHRVNKLRSQHPGAQLFLATDNRAMEELFAQTYGGVLTAPKWYPQAEIRLHESAECPDKMQNGIEALTDLYLLAGCDYLVLDTSSALSRLASILADKKCTEIRDVRRLPRRVRDVAFAARESIRWGPKRLLAGFRK